MLRSELDSNQEWSVEASRVSNPTFNAFPEAPHTHPCTPSILWLKQGRRSGVKLAIEGHPLLDAGRQLADLFSQRTDVGRRNADEREDLGRRWWRARLRCSPHPFCTAFKPLACPLAIEITLELSNPCHHARRPEHVPAPAAAQPQHAGAQPQRVHVPPLPPERAPRVHARRFRTPLLRRSAPRRHLAWPWPPARIARS
eukprot:34221-Prymnesium_polylepis.2